MPVERASSLGLNTDDVPVSDASVPAGGSPLAVRSGFGDAAFRIENVIPNSQLSVVVRAPVTLVTHYRPRILGRNVIADGLFRDADQGIYIGVVNVASDGSGGVTQTGIAQGIFRPRRVAADYAGVVGIDLDANFFGVIL